MKNIYAIIVVLLLITFGCKSDNKPKPNPNIPPKYAQIKEPKFKHEGNLQFLSRKENEIESIKIEIADTEQSRIKGLMNRKTMSDDEGMLFIFPDERRRSFWMKNTHLALDIIFVNAEKEIVHIAENCKPYSLEGVSSFEYAMYVVEVNAGFCSINGIRVGNSIQFDTF